MIEHRKQNLDPLEVYSSPETWALLELCGAVRASDLQEGRPAGENLKDQARPTPARAPKAPDEYG